MSLQDIFARAGLESADDALTAPVVVATAEEAAEAIVDKELAEANEEIAEVQADVQELETAIEALEEKHEELEEIIEGNESMLSGATPFNAGLFHDRMVRGARIVAKFGAEAKVDGVESYADAVSANLAAYEGMETMKSTAATVVAAVKKFFIDLYNGFINLFTGLFNRLKALGDKAQVLKSNILKGGEVKSDVAPPKSASVLETNGKSKAIDALIKAAGSVYAEMNKLGSGAVDSGAGAVEAVAGEIAKAGSKSVDSKTDNSETSTISIGQSAKIKLTTPLKDAGIDSTKITFALGEAPAKSTASKTDLVSILTDVINDSRRLQNAKLDKSTLTQQRDKAIGTLTRLADSAPDASKDEKKQGAGAIKAAHKATLKLGVGALKIGSEVLDAQIDFVKAHVGGAAKADDKAEKKDEKKDD